MLNTLRLFVFGYLCLVCNTTFATMPDELTLEEKVGQLLMVHFNGEEANAEAQMLIQKAYVGGFIYYNWSNSLHSPQQVAALSAGLQEIASHNRSSIPLLIATDQEGGVIARLQPGFTVFPGNKALGMTNDPSLAYQSALVMGTELQAVGINMTLAPVIDINSNPHNPVIGVRAYGETPDTVVQFGKQALLGFKQAGIIACLKHFPGHGDVTVDSHEALPVVNKSRKELANSDFFPFALLAPYADTIMTAHLLVPALDPEHCSTLSKRTINILRDEMDFAGVVITDSLVMDGLLNQCTSIEEAAIQALSAGCDILLLGGKHLVGSHKHLELSVADVQKVHQALVEAVKSGRLTPERLNQAVTRVLTLKQRYLTKEQRPTIESSTGLDDINTEAQQALASTIATRALRMTKNGQFDTLQQKQSAIFAPTVIKADLLPNLSPDRPVHFFDFLAPTETEIQQAQVLAMKHEALIIFCYNAWKSPRQIALIKALIAMKKPTALVVCRDPLDAELFAEVDCMITTYSPTAPSLKAAYSLLTNQSP